jgi:hypothetical protein
MGVTAGGKISHQTLILSGAPAARRMIALSTSETASRISCE